MNNVTDISESVIQKKLSELADAMNADMQALYRRNAANGRGLKSGATFIESMSLIKSAFSNMVTTMSGQYTWAVNQSLFISSSKIIVLKNQAKFYLEQLNKHALPHLKHTAKLVGKEKLYEQYQHEITESLTEHYKQVEIAIDTVVLEKKNQGIIGGVKAVFGWASKLFGSS